MLEILIARKDYSKVSKQRKQAELNSAISGSGGKKAVFVKARPCRAPLAVWQRGRGFKSCHQFGYLGACNGTATQSFRNIRSVLDKSIQTFMKTPTWLTKAAFPFPSAKREGGAAAEQTPEVEEVAEAGRSFSPQMSPRCRHTQATSLSHSVRRGRRIRLMLVRLQRCPVT